MPDLGCTSSHPYATSAPPSRQCTKKPKFCTTPWLHTKTPHATPTNAPMSTSCSSGLPSCVGLDRRLTAQPWHDSGSLSFITLPQHRRLHIATAAHKELHATPTNKTRGKSRPLDSLTQSIQTLIQGNFTAAA